MSTGQRHGFSRQRTKPSLVTLQSEPAEPAKPYSDEPHSSVARDTETHGSDRDDNAGEHTDDESDQNDEAERQGLLAGAGPDYPAPPLALAIEEDEHIPGAVALRNQGDPSAPADGPAWTTKTEGEPKPGPVSWSSLPRKDQLFILVVARLSEPLTQTSLAAYMFYQLKSFDSTLPDSTIAQQAGLLLAGFTGAQFLTAMMWGRLADSERVGRKRVLLVGLVGTAVGAVGFGFSGSFAAAFFWRLVGGALNGNVGVMRTMISEIIREKKFQSRAFILLPMTFNVGVILGPVMGGLLADPVHSFPGIFGEGGVLGGETGVGWMKKWPYALPNLVSALFLLFSALAVVLGLEETLDALRGPAHRDRGLRAGDWIKKHIFRRRGTTGYQAIALAPDQAVLDIELQTPTTPTWTTPSRREDGSSKQKHRQRLPFRRIFTWNVTAVLVAHGLLAAHVGLFTQMWFVFLSTPRYVDPSSTTPSAPGNTTDPNPSLHLPPSYRPHGPFVFTGGLALPPPRIGASLAVLGATGLVLQFTLFPHLTARLGTVTSYRLSLLLFPAAYVAAPFLARVPTASPAPAPADGVAFWATLVGVLFVQVLARTFALPATTILVNNASPHPSVLGTVHGVGQSVSSALRTIGPVLGGWAYGKGLNAGVVGAVWWVMAAWAMVGAVAATAVRDGDGHEIWLDGDEGQPPEAGGHRRPER